MKTQEMFGKSTKVLLIEDSHEDADLLQEMLSEARDCSYSMMHVQRLTDGLTCLRETQIDLIMTDLGLPDSQGFDTFAKLHAQVPEVPIIVLTGLDDESLGIRTVQEGAQDYLVKGQFETLWLQRSIRYAIERHRLALASVSRAALTADVFGRTPLQNSAPDIFRGLAREYEALLDRALQERVYRVECEISDALRYIAERLGRLQAGPRDVVELHSAALRHRTHHIQHSKTQAYIEEGRLMALELMGYLVTFYRTAALRTRRARGHDNPNP